ncbi:MAG: hypothetical protein OEV66_02750 [Spirochaetia bacterium]|nr:hypothetical protein [Spirochaetia bacterium]
MKKLVKLLSVIIFLNAAIIFDPAYGLDLLETNIGAETVGLGGATAAIVQNPSALFWNPAGLANINGKQKEKNKTSLNIEADQKFSEDSFDKLFENKPSNDDEGRKPARKNEQSFEMQFYTAYGYLTMDRHLFMGATAFTLFNGTFGAGVMGAYAPGIDGYDSAGMPTGQISYGAYDASAGYAWETSVVKMGFSFSGYWQALATQNYFGGGLNMGIQMTPIPIIHIGAMVQNLPGFIQYSSSVPSALNKMDTVLKMDLGISTPPPDASFLLLIGFEANLSPSSSSQIFANLGLRVTFAKHFFIMTGIRDNSFSVGFGLNLPALKIAYAVNEDKLRTGFQHFVDLNFTF